MIKDQPYTVSNSQMFHRQYYRRIPMSTSSPSSPSSSPSSTTTSFSKARNSSMFVLAVTFMAGAMVGSLVSNCNMATPSPSRTTFLTLLTFPGQQRHLVHDGNGVSYPPMSDDRNKDGWHTIDVFYGKTTRTENDLFITQSRNEETRHPIFDYAQARQDEVVLSLLRNQTNGYFVDLAANDAISLSNTYSLETYYGWKGLCVSWIRGDRFSVESSDV